MKIGCSGLTTFLTVVSTAGLVHPALAMDGGVTRASVLRPTSTPSSAAEAERLWLPLIRSNRVGEARTLCETWLQAPKPVAAEGHKCIANVELRGSATTRVESNGRGGGWMGVGNQGDGVERALAHLNQAIELAPDDLSIYQGRLHIIINSHLAGQAAKYLSDSLRTYKNRDAFQEWLAYSQEFNDMGHFEAGAAFMRVLEQRYPDKREVIANLGAFLSELGKLDEALPYLKRAVAQNPDDPGDTWNLGLAFEKVGDRKSAEAHLRRAMRLAQQSTMGREMSCQFADFLERSDRRKEACTQQKQYCPAGERRACNRQKANKESHEPSDLEGKYKVGKAKGDRLPLVPEH